MSPMVFRSVDFPILLCTQSRKTACGLPQKILKGIATVRAFIDSASVICDIHISMNIPTTTEKTIIARISANVLRMRRPLLAAYHFRVKKYICIFFPEAKIHFKTNSSFRTTTVLPRHKIIGAMILNCYLA